MARHAKASSVIVSSGPIEKFFRTTSSAFSRYKGLDKSAKRSMRSIGDKRHMIRVAFVIGDYPPEQRALREEVAKSYSSAGVEVGILSVPARPFDGLTPAEIRAAAPLFHDAFREAEREGYDAVVPLGMLDIGVEGGRSAVDIPVIAPLQAVLHVAAQVGEHFGVVCYHPSAIPRHRAQTIAYGMEQFIAGRRASGFYVQHISENKDRMVQSILRTASDLIEEYR